MMTDSVAIETRLPRLAPAVLDTLLSAAKSDLRERLLKWFGLAVSAGVLVIIASQINMTELAKVARTAPGFSIFWPIFALSYLTVPLSEWVIYRRIWRLPAGAIVPLIRKWVANEVVLGYSGEAQFYLWARRYAGVSGSPFGAIKDTAVLSALAGNLAALVMMLAMAPFLSMLLTGGIGRTLAISTVIVVIGSLVPLLLRRILFSLPRRDLQIIFAVHLTRIALVVILAMSLWRLLLPAVAIGRWLALVTLRMMLSRLPLLPNKDILFAGATMLLLGRAADISAVVALMASLGIAAHVIVGTVTGIGALVDRRTVG